MDTKFKVDETGDGVALIRVDVNDQGVESVSRWNMQGDQIEKHLRGIDDKDHPFKAAPRGDLEAARDMANEARKQIES